MTMNDFTKEELIKIIAAFEYWHHKNNIMQPQEYAEVRKKIQSMIDNYCEHEEEKIIGERMNYYSGKCKKCGEFYI